MSTRSSKNNKTYSQRLPPQKFFTLRDKNCLQQYITSNNRNSLSGVVNPNDYVTITLDNDFDSATNKVIKVIGRKKFVIMNVEGENVGMEDFLKNEIYISTCGIVDKQYYYLSRCTKLTESTCGNNSCLRSKRWIQELKEDIRGSKGREEDDYDTALFNLNTYDKDKQQILHKKYAFHFVIECGNNFYVSENHFEVKCNATKKKDNKSGTVMVGTSMEEEDSQSQTVLGKRKDYYDCCSTTSRECTEDDNDKQNNGPNLPYVSPDHSTEQSIIPNNQPPQYVVLTEEQFQQFQYQYQQTLLQSFVRLALDVTIEELFNDKLIRYLYEEMKEKGKSILEEWRANNNNNHNNTFNPLLPTVSNDDNDSGDMNNNNEMTNDDSSTLQQNQQDEEQQIVNDKYDFLNYDSE